MNNQLILGKIVRRPKNGSYRLFEATINGEPCYCMTTPSQSEKIIFDHTKSVLTAMKRVKAYYGKSKKVRIGFKEKHLGSVLFRIYNGNDIWKSTHYSMLKDRSMESEGILDYRSSNMESAEKKPPEISIIHRPGEPLERYIVVTYMGVTEIFDYSERVYNYLLDKKIQIVLGKGSNTTPPRLKSRKNKFASSSFLSNTIFKLYMGGLGSSEHCSHVHSGYRWNNCLENLMVMDGSTNDSMSDLASRIGGHIQMYSIVYRNSEGERILVELSWIGVGRFYFVCRTPETYLNFQKIITGVAALTAHTNLYLNEEQIDTPRQAYEQTAEKFNHTEDMISEFWKWCDARDRLNAYYCKYPKKFLEWNDNPLEMLKNYHGKPIAVYWKIEPVTQEKV